MSKKAEAWCCAKCGGELEKHPLLRDVMICRCCEIEYDHENRRIEWTSAGRRIENAFELGRVGCQESH